MTKTFKFKDLNLMYDFEEQHRIWEGEERWSTVSLNKKLLTIEIRANAFSKKTLQAAKDHGGIEI